MAFPILDSDTSNPVPEGTELASPDLSDLEHQLQLSGGLSAPLGGGWTIIPRIDWQEELTDNALQQHSPRSSDLATYIAPGIGIAGEMPRLSLTFDWSPVLTLYARNTDLNTLTQQLNALGSVTLVPDLAFVDVRAAAGVGSLFGGGAGSLGASAFTPTQGLSGLAGNGSGLNRDNEIQTTSLQVSPYVLGHFGHWADARLGDNLSVTEADQLSGFASSPFPTSGNNATRLLTNEENLHVVSGDVLQFIQNALDIDFQQSTSQTGAGFAAVVPGGVPPADRTYTSTRNVAQDQVNYVVNRAVTVFASGGYEDISYSNAGAPRVNDLIWSFGGSLSGPRSSLSVSYGHQNGFNSLTVNGQYSLTARTSLTVSYGSTLGTQLEGVQNALSGAVVGPNGTLVNPNGSNVFNTANTLGFADGVFRTTTLQMGAQTNWDRDQASLSLLVSQQTGQSPGSLSHASNTTVAGTWVHQMRPDMTLTGSASYTLQHETGGSLDQYVVIDGVLVRIPYTPTSNPFNGDTLGLSLVWQWELSDTASVSVRYAYFDRQSQNVLYSLYENILILGLSKRF